MSKTVKQQILISGVGGQGVLFVTGLLAEAAIGAGLTGALLMSALARLADARADEAGDAGE